MYNTSRNMGLNRAHRDPNTRAHGPRPASWSVGREPVEQQVERGVGHSAAAPPDFLRLLRRRLTTPLAESAAAQLRLLARSLLAVDATARCDRLPLPLQRRRELAEPRAGQAGRRCRRRRHGESRSVGSRMGRTNLS
jgi:hypothetical protein